MADQKQTRKPIVRRIITGLGRIMWPHLTAPNTGGQYPSKKYEVTFAWPKDDAATTDALNAAMLKVAMEAWPDKVKTLDDFASFVKDGDDKAGFEGSHFITPKGGRQPEVVDGRRQKIDPAEVKNNDLCRLQLSAGAFELTLDKEVAQALHAAGKVVFRKTGPDGKKVSYSRPAVTFYLDAVQRVKPGGTGADVSAFPEETVEADGGWDDTPGAGPADDGFDV